MTALSTLSNATSNITEVIVPQLVQPLSTKRRKRRWKNRVGYNRKGRRRKDPPSSISSQSISSLDQPSQPPSVATIPTLTHSTLAITPSPSSAPSNQPSSPTTTSTPIPESPSTPSPVLPPTPVERGPKGKRMTEEYAFKMRVMIEMIFRLKFYKTYSREKLNGKDGIVQEICCWLNYKSHATVRRVIVSVYEAIKEEKEYDAARKKYEIEMTRKIKKGTYSHHLLTVLKENNNSFRTATLGLNALTCAVTDEEPVGLTAVYNTIHRCNYEKTRTKNVPQTNIKNEIYRQARYNWFAQFLARLGEKIPEDDDSEYRKRLKNEWIDYDKLKEEKLNMELTQIGFWDECHIKQFVGCDNDETYIFARDENGLYDENGEIDEEGNRKVSERQLHFY